MKELKKFLANLDEFEKQSKKVNLMVGRAEHKKKNMNFEQYIENNYFPQDKPTGIELQKIKEGWDAAKEETLKLIKEYTYQGENWQGDEYYDCITNVEGLTKDIKEL